MRTTRTSTGAAADNIIVATSGLALTGSYEGNGGADTFTATLGAAGTLDLSGATITNIESLVWGDNNNSTVTIDEANLASFVTAITGGAGAETLNLFSTGTGVFNFSTTAMTAIDAVTIANGGNHVTFDAADVAAVTSLDGSAAGVTTVSFNDTVDLSATSIADVDVLTIGGINQTLTVDNGQFTATNFTTVTGNTDSNLEVNAAANLDLTNTAISGFDLIDVTAIGANTISIDAASIANTALTFAAAGNTLLAVTETTTGTNWNFAAGSLVEIDLSAGVTFSVNETVLTATLNTVLGAGGTENFDISASTAGAAINMVNIATATGLEAINVTDGAGANAITTSAWDGVRAITNVSLGAGSDVVALDNQAISTAATSATITGFLAGNVGLYDQISAQVGGTSISDGVFFERTSGIGTVQLADSTVLAANTSWFTAVNLTNVVNVLATITGNGVTADANAAATLVVYDGLGHAGIYQLAETTGAVGAFDECELVGVVTTASNSLTAVNFV